jgi:hypothetical protein
MTGGGLRENRESVDSERLSVVLGELDFGDGNGYGNGNGLNLIRGDRRGLI